MSSQTAGAVPGPSDSWSDHVGNAMAVSSRSASVALPGPRVRMGSADGLQLTGAHSASAVGVARGCSPFPLGETLVS
jgi:hypothetical protein